MELHLTLVGGVISALNWNAKGGFDLNNNIFMNNAVKANAPIFITIVVLL